MIKSLRCKTGATVQAEDLHSRVVSPWLLCALLPQLQYICDQLPLNVTHLHIVFFHPAGAHAFPDHLLCSCSRVPPSAAGPSSAGWLQQWPAGPLDWCCLIKPFYWNQAGRM